MDLVTDHLFVYGTLLRQFPGSQSRWLEQRATYLGTYQLPGRLYDLGQYPGFIYHPQASTWVKGEILRLHSPALTLAALDTYEGIVPGSSEEQEYERILITTNWHGTPIDLYLYQLLVDTQGLHHIASGDYLRACLIEPD